MLSHTLRTEADFPDTPLSKPQSPPCAEKPGFWQKEAFIKCEPVQVQSQVDTPARVRPRWHSQQTLRGSRRQACGILSSSFSSVSFVFWTYLWKAKDALNIIYSNKNKSCQLFLTKICTEKCKFPVFTVNWCIFMFHKEHFNDSVWKWWPQPKANPGAIWEDTMPPSSVGGKDVSTSTGLGGLQGWSGVWFPSRRFSWHRNAHKHQTWAFQ